MSERRPATGGRQGLRLCSVFGIEVRLDLSVLIIFALIVTNLGAGLFPQWHPEWTPGTVWLTALAAGLLFFASLLAHELSHSLVARRYGIQVPRITLYLFGGVAEIAAEPATPEAEFNIAIAGPLMSLALGLMFALAASAAMGEQQLAALVEKPDETMAALSPAVTACLWLASVNLLLAVFNMIPGFPLDGGRVFRAAVWRVTGSQLLATRLASTAGKWFGWGLMGLGLWNLLALRSLGGLWLILIGWFLSHLATASYTQLLTQRALRSLRVRDVMRTRFEHVPARASIEEFVEDYLLRSNQLLWPVRDGDRVLGTVGLGDATRVPVGERSGHPVTAIMTPLDERPVLDPDLPATSALTRLLAAGDEPVAVVRGGDVLGLVRGSDILRWVMLHQDGRAP